ncbi:MAG: 50S ribosomal protein L25 [Acidobacteriota bacterium]
MKEITLTAKPRDERGKNAARRMRHAGMIPAVLYGSREGASSMSVNPSDVLAILKSDQGENTVFQLKLGEQAPVQAMIRDYQLDPVTHALLHADVLRIAADRALKLDVQLELTGTPAGIKDGGVLEHVLREIEVECLPADIPEKISVDVSGMGIATVLRLRDVDLPPRVKVLTDLDLVIAAVAAPKKVEEEAAPVEAAAAEPAEPEVVRKGKAAAGEEEETEKK